MRTLPTSEQLLPHVVSDKDPAWRYVRDREVALRRGDWLAMFIVVGLVVCIVEPNINGAIKSSRVGKFFRSAPVQTQQAQAASTPAQSFFPLVDITPTLAKISDRVGSVRPLGCKVKCREHEGVDYAYKGRIISALSGKIIEFNPDAESGGAIGITSSWQGKTINIRYLHLDRQPLRRFHKGQSVEAGALLSKVSTTFPGSSGPHPHIEVRVNRRLHRKPEKFLAGLVSQEVSQEISQGIGGVWHSPIQASHFVVSQGFHRYHEGIDFAGAAGTPVQAVADGEIIFAQWDEWGLGNAVTIRHAGGYETVYGHNQRLLVRSGDRVRRGQTIAEVGSTGNSTGSHLHFELRKDGNALNPEDLIAFFKGEN